MVLFLTFAILPADIVAILPADSVAVADDERARDVMRVSDSPVEYQN